MIISSKNNFRLNSFIKSALKITILAICISVLPVLVAIIFQRYSIFNTVFCDWTEAYHPAIIKMFSGGSPYDVQKFYNPPWILILLAPLSFLDDHIAGILLGLISLASYGFAAFRLKAKPLALALIVFSPPVLRGIWEGNVDFLVALGAILPPQIGLFLVLLKPQVGIGIALYWFFTTLKPRGWLVTAKIFLPVTIAFFLSFAIYGLWFLDASKLATQYWNISFWSKIWPNTILVGVGLLFIAVRSQNFHWSFLSSPFFSPYLAVYSLGVPLLGLVCYPSIILAVVVILWVIQFTLGNGIIFPNL